MAYGLKYQSNFYNFFGKLVSILISKEDYVGEVTQVRTSEVIIEANYEDDNTPIIGHGAKIVVQIEATDLSYMEDLLISYERQFQCVIQYDGVTAFRGYSLCDLNERQLLPYAAITLQFTDYLHRLEEQYPTCLSSSNKNILILDLVQELIDRSNIEVPLYVNSTLFESQMDQTEIDTFLPQVRIQNFQFYTNASEYDNMYDAINKALQPFNAFIYYYNEVWVIERQEDVNRNGDWVKYSDTSTGALSLAAGTFVYLYGTSVYYPSGIYLQSWGRLLIFTALVPGVNFSGETTISSPITGDLTGTVQTTIANAGAARSIQITFDNGSGVGLINVGTTSANVICNTSGSYYADLETFIADYYAYFLAEGYTLYHTLSNVIQIDGSLANGAFEYTFWATYGNITGHWDVLTAGANPTSRVDIIGLTGSSGSAYITCNGITRTVSIADEESGFTLSQPSITASLKQEINKQDGDFEYVDCSQIIEYDSGLRTLILRLNDTLLDSLIFNNYTDHPELLDFTDQSFISVDMSTWEYRTWYAHDTLTNIQTGISYRGMDNWIKYTSTAGRSYGLYYRFKVQFAISVNLHTILKISYKQTVDQPTPGWDWVFPHFLLRVVGGKYDGYFMKVGTTSAEVSTIRLYKQLTDPSDWTEWASTVWYNYTDINVADNNLEWTMDKEFNLTGLHCRVYQPNSTVNYTDYDSFYEAAEFPVTQDFVAVLLPPWYSEDEDKGDATNIETAYFGDITAALTQVDEIDNKIEYHINENFVKKEEIDVYFFDLANANYSNGMLLDDGATYTVSWISAMSPSPIPLYEVFAKCKFRKWGRTIHRLKGTIQYDGILKVFAIITDDNLMHDSSTPIEFHLNGFSWDLNLGQYEIEAEEYTNEDIIVSGVAYTSEGDPDLYVPDPVTGLFVDLRSITLGIWTSWNPVGGTLIGYELERKPHWSIIQNQWSDSWIRITPTNPPFTYTQHMDRPSAPYSMTGMEFTYRVRAYNSMGYSDWSTEESVIWTY